MKGRWVTLVIAAAVLECAPGIRAHWEEEYHWPAGSIIPVQLQMGASPALADGSADWDTVAEAALNSWNAVLSAVVFQPARDAAVEAASQDGTNNVIWGSDVYGEPFGEGVLAITLTIYTIPDNATVETDVVFNRAIAWNSYRGDLRRTADGGTLYDLQRVALHEFGHALGLGHPDDHGQVVTAIMNSRASNVDALQPDDIDGVSAMYKATRVPFLTSRVRQR